MKRSSDPSLPTPESKYAKHEIPPPSSKKLKHLREDIQGSKTPESTDDVPDFDLDNVYAAACSAIASLPGDTYLSKLVREVQGKCLSAKRTLLSVIGKGAFWTKPSHTEFGYEFPTWDTSEELQHQEFVNQSPLEGLRAHIVEQLTELTPSQTQIYGRYCSIVQSSGMGKSHLLDEFSKSYFLIPINLRASTDQGYPPADREVWEFLTQNDSDSSALSLIKHFLLALFIKTKEALGCMGFTKSDQIQEFQSYMSKDQSMQSPGKNRTDFYKGVVAQARQFQKRMKNSSGKPKTTELAQALYGLREVLNSGDKLLSGHCIFLWKGHHKRCIDSKDCVDVFIAFDEAHMLADSFDNIRKHESRFVVL
ncbi:hypothetical protein EDB85DRAFT_1896565 [Lactarius pseudohatsudake]|nr:hypothetical protein EDB85DRAFT_1896565 [Lactarius pseudohatsudake]